VVFPVVVLASVLVSVLESEVGEMWLNLDAVQPLIKIAVAPMAATLRGVLVFNNFTANLFLSQCISKRRAAEITLRIRERSHKATLAKMTKF
jgi:hypothetical protein